MIVVLDRDCLPGLVPLGWINKLRQGKPGVLRIGAHPDVTPPVQFEHVPAHA